MPRAKKTEEEVTVPANVSTTGVYVVFTASNGEARSYTLEQHGPKAKELANQYANKIGGSVKEA